MTVQLATRRRHCVVGVVGGVGGRCVAAVFQGRNGTSTRSVLLGLLDVRVAVAVVVVVVVAVCHHLCQGLRHR